jgi:hypothetical protein
MISCNTSPFLTRSVQLISPFFSSITFQNVTGISDLLSEVSRFQHQKKLCSKCGTLLVSSLYLSQIRWCFNAAFDMANLDLVLHVYLASLAVTLPNYLKYSTFSTWFLSVIICKGNGYLKILITLVFPHSFPFHSIFQFQLVYQSCGVLRFHS